jgi:hypothetical protein
VLLKVAESSAAAAAAAAAAATALLLPFRFQRVDMASLPKDDYDDPMGTGSGMCLLYNMLHCTLQLVARNSMCGSASSPVTCG